MALAAGTGPVTFISMWENENNRLSESTTDDIVQATRDKLNAHLSLGILSPHDVCEEILQYVDRRWQDFTNWYKHRQLLMQAVDLLATWRVDERPLVRAILTLLYHLSKMLDREIFFLDKPDTAGTSGNGTGFLELSPIAREKFLYIVGHVAGWRLPLQEPWERCQPNTTYLDLPLHKSNDDGVTMLLSDIIYRVRDADLVLLLLRCGVKPCAMLLWPITIQIDLNQTLHDFYRSADLQRRLSASVLNHECACIQYFCRARNNFTIYLQHSVTSPRRTPLDDNISQDNLLLMPDHVTIEDYIPDDRWRHPASLMQQARLAVRKAVYFADTLPEGINRLPLPKLLISYVDLLID